MEENKSGLIEVTLTDFLPSKEELQKFIVAYRNDSSILSVNITKDDEQLLSEYDTYCREFQFDPDILFNALFISRVFYESVNNISLNELGEPRKSKIAYRILSQYDIGYGHDWTDEFESDKELIDHYREVMISYAVFDGDDTIEDLIDQGLFIFKEIE